MTRLAWRKPRYQCAGCARALTESDDQVPARQHVTRRFRARLAERVVGDAVHAEVAREERTSRNQVSRAFADCAGRLQAPGVGRWPRRLSLDEAHHRRGQELATSSQIWTAGESSRSSAAAIDARVSAGC